MSSPAETVDAVMRWLEGLFGIVLPTLPLPGAWAKLAALWELPILGSLPDPEEPMPWIIDVEPAWTAPISGVTISPQRLQIRVEQTGSPAPIFVEMDRPAPRRATRKRTAASSRSRAAGAKRVKDLVSRTLLPIFQWKGERR